MQHGSFTTTALDHTQPEPLTPGSPINLTLGDTSRQLSLATSVIGNWSDLIRRQVNLGDPTFTSSSRFKSNQDPRLALPDVRNWNDLVVNQVDLGGYTSTSTPLPSPSLEKDREMMNVREQRARVAVAVEHHLTWDELVEQGAMLGDDGTDTLVMKKKAALFE